MHKKAKYYRVNDVTWALDGYAGKKYGGKVGRLRYHNTAFSMFMTGFPIVLIFSEEGSTAEKHDGFEIEEVTLAETQETV